MKINLFLALLIVNISAYSMDNNNSIERKADTNLVCSVCKSDPNGFEDETALAKHQNKVHGAKVDYKALKKRKILTNLYCNFCKKEVWCKTDGDLRFHLENQDKVCYLCYKKCSPGEDLFNHITEKHPEEIKPIKLDD